LDGPAPGPGDASGDLYNLLQGATAGGGVQWLQALRDAWAQRNRINGEEQGTLNPVYNLKNDSLYALDLDALQNAVSKALGPYHPPAAPALVLLPRLAPAGGAFYVLRCVSRRPGCRPPHADVVSPPSAAFQLAPFFDPDAPARPVRIAL